MPEEKMYRIDFGCSFFIIRESMSRETYDPGSKFYSEYTGRRKREYCLHLFKDGIHGGATVSYNFSKSELDDFIAEINCMYKDFIEYESIGEYSKEFLERKSTNKWRKLK